MRWFSCFVTSLCISGCAPFLADGFGSHDAETNIYQYITIEAHGAELVTPGDIHFTYRKNEVRKAVRRTDYDHVLLYGTTTIEPFYEVRVLDDPPKIPHADLVFDTLVGGSRLVVAGNGLADPIPASDFRFLIEQMKVIQDE